MITDKDGNQKTGIFVDKEQAAATKKAAKFTVPPTKDPKSGGRKYTMSEVMKMKNENPDLDIKEYM